MANDCLITKLKGTVNNDNLLCPGEMKIKVKFSSASAWVKLSGTSFFYDTFKSSIPIYWGVGGPSAINVLGSSFNWKELHPEITSASGSIYFKPVNATDEVVISIPNKYGLISNDKASDVMFESINGFEFLPNLQTFNLLGAVINTRDIKSEVLQQLSNYGNDSIVNLSDFPATMKIISCLNVVNLSGNLSALTNMSTLNRIELGKSSVLTTIDGSVNNIPISSLTQVRLGWLTNVTGNITHFNNASSLIRLELNHTGVNGSINGLPKSLTTLEVNDTAVTGDLKTMADNMVTAGRTSGTLTVMVNDIITNDGAAITKTTYTITFSGGSYTIS